MSSEGFLTGSRRMGLKESIKPITYLKNHAADLVRTVSEQGGPVIITQNGCAKVVVMDVELYDSWRKAMTMLKILARSEQDFEAGQTVSTDEAFRRAGALARRAARRG